MEQLILRQAAIDALRTCYDTETITMDNGDEYINYGDAVGEIEQLPSALGTNLAEVGTDLISRAQAIDALTEYGNGRAVFISIGEAVIRIEQLPSAQAKRGKWISADAMFGGVPFYCSECGENTRDTVMGKPRWNFCPNCGADMREDGENSEIN